MFSKKKYTAVVTFILALASFSIAYAAHTTINTNDGQVDSNWSNVAVLSNDGDDIGNDNYDIDQAWVANASDNSGYFFRVSLVGSGQLPHNYSSFEARLDCNQNGSYFDSVDVVVYYAINGTLEELVECQGDDYFDCDYSAEPNNSDTNLDTFGEEISGTHYNYEWRADTQNGATDWSQCFNQIDVQLMSLNSSFSIEDSTEVRTYNAPTAVSLTNLTASGGTNNWTLVVVVSGLTLLLIVSIWVTKRFRKLAISKSV